MCQVAEVKLDENNCDNVTTVVAKTPERKIQMKVGSYASVLKGREKSKMSGIILKAEMCSCWCRTRTHYNNSIPPILIFNLIFLSLALRFRQISWFARGHRVSAAQHVRRSAISTGDRRSCWMTSSSPPHVILNYINQMRCMDAWDNYIETFIWFLICHLSINRVIRPLDIFISVSIQLFEYQIYICL